jgi:hypothetical protein
MGEAESYAKRRETGKEKRVQVIRPVTHRSPLLLTKSVITALKYDLLNTVIPTNYKGTTH